MCVGGVISGYIEAAVLFLPIPPLHSVPLSTLLPTPTYLPTPTPLTWLHSPPPPLTPSLLLTRVTPPPQELEGSPEVVTPSGLTYRDLRRGGGQAPIRGYLVVLDYV